MRLGSPSASPIRLNDVFADPDGVGERLPREVNGLFAVRCSADPTTVIYSLELAPWAPMAAHGYPRERLGVLVHLDGRIFATPQPPAGRRWLHRYAYEASVLEELCLWYPGDPRALRWGWEDGLAGYVTIAHRHLMAEEYWRRNDRWPLEDAPHGPGEHPVSGRRLLHAAGEWWRP